MIWLTLLTFLTWTPAVSNGANILAVVGVPSFSHQQFYRAYLKALHDKGHNLTVVTPNPIKDPTMANYREIDQSFLYAEFQKIFDVSSETSRSQLIVTELLIFLFGKIVRALCHKILSDPNLMDIYKRNEKFDLFVVEWATLSCVLPFEKLADGRMIGISSFEIGPLPQIGLGSVWSPSFAADPNLVYSDRMTFFQRARSAIFFWFSLGYLAILRRDQTDIARHYFGEDVEDIYDLERKVALVFDNSHVTMSYPRANNINHIPLGGPAFHLSKRKPQPLPKDLKDFLDNAPNGVIYFSLGTNVNTKNMSEKVEKIFLESFSRIKQKILWKWANEDLKVNLKTVKVGKWFPQVDILAHPNVKAFVTQGGLQSIGEAIEYQVPMVVMPFFADQNHNAKKMEVEGVALNLDFDQLNVDTFTWALNEIVSNKKYKENMIRFSALVRDQPVPTLEKAVWWTEYVIRHNGAPHLRSAAATMPWYQYLMLDVLAVIFFVLFIVLYIVYSVFRLVFRCLVKVKKD